METSVGPNKLLFYLFGRCCAAGSSASFLIGLFPTGHRRQFNVYSTLVQCHLIEMCGPSGLGSPEDPVLCK